MCAHLARCRLAQQSGWLIRNVSQRDFERSHWLLARGVCWCACVASLLAMPTIKAAPTACRARDPLTDLNRQPERTFCAFLLCFQAIYLNLHHGKWNILILWCFGKRLCCFVDCKSGVDRISVRISWWERTQSSTPLAAILRKFQHTRICFICGVRA